MSKVPITENEKSSPFYKYYDRKIVAPPKEKMEMLKANPLTEETALAPENMNDLFKDGYLDGEFGWTRMKNGCLTLANLTDMPGVTVEMMDWWFAWHGIEPMRYKIWDADDHFYCQTRNMEKALDKTLSLKERYWNTIHDVTEDIGGGQEQLVINFRNPLDIGFDKDLLEKFDGTIICAGNEQTPVIMCHFIRPTDTGCELRTRFWIGYCVKDGKPQQTIIPPGAAMPDVMAIGLCAHNVKEYTNLAAILPEVYKEFKDSWEPLAI